MDVQSLSRSGSKGPVALAVAEDVVDLAAVDVVVSTAMEAVATAAMVATVPAMVATAPATVATVPAEIHIVVEDAAAVGGVIVAVRMAMAMAAGRALTKVPERKQRNGMALKPAVCWDSCELSND
jgi:hypothetical protein